MDFKTIENTIKISEAKTISAAAEEVYITQSALNQQLIRLEEELGVILFSRSKAGVVPTEAGKAYLAYANKLVALKNEMFSVLNDYAEYKTGTIRIGMPVIHGLEMFTHIFPKFHQKYPGIKLEPIEQTYSKRLHFLNTGKTNLAFISLPKMDRPEYQYYPILQEELFLVVPKTDPRCIRFREMGEIDFSLMAQDPFVMIEKGTTLRMMINAMCKEAHIRPRIIMETSSYKSLISIVRGGFACTISPRLESLDDPDVAYFPLQGHPYRTFCAIHKKGTYLSEPLKEVIEMATAYWKA